VKGKERKGMVEGEGKGRYWKGQRGEEGKGGGGRGGDKGKGGSGERVVPGC
jgi:hypothetical protein